jgi:hypothetical protein
LRQANSGTAVADPASQYRRRLLGQGIGQLLIDALQASPHRDIKIAPNREPMPVRSVTLI